MLKKVSIFFILIIFLLIKCVSYAETTAGTNLFDNQARMDIMKEANKNTQKVDPNLKIYDMANLLSENEEKKLFEKVSSYINKYNMDIVIVTINSNNKASSMEYADDFYDYNDFGIDNQNSGILFLIDMDNRNMWISTTGKAIGIYTDNRIDKILDYTYFKISKQDYYGCANEFIKYASAYAGLKSKGSVFVVALPDMIIISIAGGAFATMVYIIIGVSKNKTVKKQSLANAYISGDVNITLERDIMVSKNVSKSPRETSSGSHGGGSSIHSGSSGISHGGGGRSF